MIKIVMGLAIAEGAGVLTLEPQSRVAARGAHVYANIIGYGTSTDAVNRIEPSADAIQLGRAIKIALDDAGLSLRILIIFVPTEQEAKLGMRPKQKPSKMFLVIMPRR